MPVKGHKAHKTLHQDGGSDEISVAGLSGLLADEQHVLDSELTQYTLVDGTRAFTGEVAGVDPTLSPSLATKEYVDTALGGIMQDYFLIDTLSEIGAYYQMHDHDDGGALSTFNSGELSNGNDQLVVSWITPAGEPLFRRLPVGLYNLHFHAARTTGNRVITMYAKLFEYTTAAAENLILTTETTPAITASAPHEIHASLTTEYELAAGSRLLLKLYANVSGTGATTSNIAVYAEGTMDSHLSLLSSLEILNDVYVRIDSVDDAPVDGATAVPISSNYAFDHKADASAHHVKYTDAEAVTAMGVKADNNPLDHDKYTDANAVSAMGAKADNNPLNHDRYTDALAVAAAKTVKLDELTAPTDVTTLNATNAVHGLLLKLTDDTTKFLRSDGGWQVPAGGGPTIVPKTANETCTNDSSLNNDTHLLFTVAANEVWTFTLHLTGILEGTGVGGADIDFAFAVPTGAIIYKQITFGTISSAFTDGTVEATLDTTTTAQWITLCYLYIGGANAGTVQLQWAQRTAGAKVMTIGINSYILAHKLA